MSYQSTSMLWALHVTDSPLDCDHDLDLEHLPLLGQWHLSGLLPQVCVLSLQCPLSWLTFNLQHELKWFLLPHLWHFLSNAGQSLYACIILHLLHVLLVLCLSVLPLCELLASFEWPFLLPFLPCLKLSIALIVVGWAVPPLDLWWLNLSPSSHVPWRTEVVQCMLRLLTISLTGPTSLPQSAWLHEIITRFYVPVFLPPCTDISWVDSLYVDLAYLSTHHHLAWCHCGWCGSSRRSTLLVYPWWPEKLPQDPSLHWHPLIWAKCSIV